MLNDDEQLTDPEDDRDWLNSELEELQAEGMAKKRISEAKKTEMLKVQSRIGYSSLIDLLTEHFPDVLTEKGRRKKSEEDRDLREMRHTREFAESITVEGIGPRPSNERPATEKQINYLRDLGVRDEGLLCRLGIEQASGLIDKVLEARNKRYNAEPIQNKAGCLGLVIVFSAIISTILILSAWAIHAGISQR